MQSINHTKSLPDFSVGGKRLLRLSPLVLAALFACGSFTVARADETDASSQKDRSSLSASTEPSLDAKSDASLHTTDIDWMHQKQLRLSPKGMKEAEKTEGFAPFSAEECARRGGQLSTEGRRYPFAIRLGALLSPRTKFMGGIDITFPSLGIASGWVGRVDAEAILSANFGGISTLVPVTFNEVYYAPERSGSVRFYGGGGIGPYFGEVTRFGGKLFIGANFTPHLSGEVGVHFAGQGDALISAQVRVPF